MKKIFLFLAATFCLCMANKTMAQVVDSGTTGDCTWKLTGTSSNYTLTISGNGAMGNYIDSNRIISKPWFSYNIKTLVIQQGVTSIGEAAFVFCTDLISVSIPNSVTTIGNSAFSNCSGLTSISIPNSVTTIENSAFSNCSGLTSISIPNSVTTIGSWAFSGCSGLTSVTIPNSVTTIGYGAFSNCSSLTSITVDASNTAYYTIAGVLFNKNQTILISYPAGKTGSYTIPDSVMTIGDWAFSGCSGLGSISIPRSVTTIGDYAFSDCSGLTSVIIPNSVTSIGDGIFYACSGLTSVIISNAVTIIGDWAFTHCRGLTSVIIGNSVTIIGDDAFSGCIGLTSVIIGNSVTTIGSWAFYSCSGLTSISIPNSVTSIGHSAFSNCVGLTSVIIGNSVTSIGSWAFSGCSGLTSVTIPNSVTSISNYTFYACYGLTSVTIPNSVTSIGNEAFFSCSGLTGIYVKAITPLSISNNTFSGVLTTIPVHVPCGSETVYQNADYWKNFTNIIGDLPLFGVTVQSNDVAMGSATITKSNTCTDNTVIIEAMPNIGYRFVQWNDNDTNNPRTISSVTQDTTFIAEFEAIMYYVTVSVNGNSTNMGTVSGGGDYAVNTTATITAIANTGYQFVQWNDGNKQNPRTLTVIQDTTFTAEFEVANAIKVIKESTICIYPNPVKDNITVVLPENIYQAIFMLYDMQGKVLLNQEISNQDVVLVSNLATGIYIYNVITDKESHHGKLKIMKK
jgi:hypothetical protein